MKKQYFLLAIFASQIIVAQIPDFGYAVSYGGFSFGTETIIYPNGDYVSGGRYLNTIDLNPSSGVSEFTSEGDSDIYLAKHQADGTFIWGKSIGEASSNSLYDVALTTDNQLLVAGSFENQITIDSQVISTNENPSVFLASLNSSGIAQWAFGLQSSEGITLKNIKIAPNGDILLMGKFNGTADFDPSSSGTFELTAPEIFVYGNIYIARYTAQGDFLNAWQLEGENYKSAGSLVLNPAGGYYLSGTYSGNLDVNPDASETELISSDNVNTFMIKLDNDFDFIWSRQFNPISNGTLPSVECHAIIASSSGDLYVSGEFRNTVDFDPDPSSEYTVVGINIDSTFPGNAYIVKLNSDGNFVWFRTIDNAQQRNSTLSFDNESKLIVTGVVFGSNIDVNPDPSGTQLISSGPNVYTDYVAYILSLQPNGDFNWAGSIGASDLTTSIDGITYHSDGSIVMTGTFDLTADLDPTTSVYELTAVDNVYDGFVIKMHGMPLSINDFENNDVISLFPNPATTTLNVQLSLQETIDTVVVVDMQGRTVLKFEGDTSTINIEELRTGMYFCIVQTANQRFSKKFIKK